MGKKLKNLKWESVALEGFSGEAMTENFQGFVGLEECTDYGLDKEKKVSKKPKKKKKSKPKKRKAATTETPPMEILSKKIKLDNGFTVETCVSCTKPSLSNETSLTTVGDKKTDKKKKEVSNNQLLSTKKKFKLGENELSMDLNVKDMAAWSQLGIPDEILKALAEQGFQKPTRIQELTLPTAMLGRRDILGAAETGSGKTLAFGIPILAGIMKLKEKEKAGQDVYDYAYKKTSTKKKAEDTNVSAGKKIKKSKVKKEKKHESSEEGYSSGKSDDEISETQNDAGSDKNDSSEEYLEEYDVPIKKKAPSLDEGNASDDDDANYVHLSDMIDSENDTSDNEVNQTDDEQIDGEETDSQSEVDEEENGDAIGCVKVIDNIEIPGHVIRKTGKPLYALILTPTRELAIQISRHLIAAAKYTGIRIATIVGGMASVKQERVLSKGPEIVVATPGRLWELLRQGQPHLEQIDCIKFLAIDETDRMVERNHFEELHPLLERINLDEARKCARQNFVFSATLTLVHDLPTHMKGKKVTKRGKIINRKIQKMTSQQKIKKLVDMIGMTEPKVVDITAQNLGTAETLTECRITCALEQKDHYLYYVLKRHPGRTIVFCNSIGSVKRLAQLFGLLKCKPLPLHASMPQRQRLKNLERFRDEAHGVLIATDVAARGLDIPDVDHVIHYQVPRTAENYVHRSGRTARASKEGLTILMLEPGEAYLYSKLCRTLGKQAELPTFPVPSHVLNSMKEVVACARDLERLLLAHRRSAKEQGWLDKAAREMDMIVDDDFVQTKQKDDSIAKKLQIKKKQLEALISKPLFPKGFSYKYPTLNDEDALNLSTGGNALQVMKNAIESGALKKDKRSGKNEHLLKLSEKLKK